MKNRIFSKFKDYNHILDQLLEKKNFSEDAKNLLLSMIYKIETSYKDYANIKGVFQKQNEFIDEIIKIISENCNYIFLIDPKKDEVKILKKENVLAITDEREKRIYAYPTEQAILYGLFDIKPKCFYIPRNYYYIKNQLQRVLDSGSILNSTEVIRNFNGWSWNIAEDANIDYISNMIYQAIRMVLDEEFLKEWENDTTAKTDYIYELRKEIIEYYDKERSNGFYFALSRLLIAASSREAKLKLKDEYVKVLNAYENMKDKTTYIYKISENKKKLNLEIENIDLLINNQSELLKEFKRRNRELPEDRKIFNVSDLVEILTVERNKYVNQIKHYNELVKPLNYAKLKNELSEKIKIMSVVIEEKNLKDYIIAFQKEVIKCFVKDMENIKSKEDILEIIYKLRYYKKIRITPNEKVEDIPILNNSVEKILKNLITIACKEKMFNIFCKDIEYNYRIIAKALDTTIANYEDVDISVKLVDKEVLEVTVYDNEIIDKKEEMIFPISINDLDVKQKKRVSLYVF